MTHGRGMPDYIDVDSQIADKRGRDVIARFEAKAEAKSLQRKMDDAEANKAKLEKAEALVAEMRMELDLYVAPHYKRPNTWDYLSADVLERGDAVLIDDAIYVVVKKLKFRQKIANILCQMHHNPAKYKRIGSVDFVFAYPGYVSAFQLDRLGVEL